MLVLIMIPSAYSSRSTAFYSVSFGHGGSWWLLEEGLPRNRQQARQAPTIIHQFLSSPCSFSFWASSIAGGRWRCRRHCRLLFSFSHSVPGHQRRMTSARKLLAAPASARAAAVLRSFGGKPMAPPADMSMAFCCIFFRARTRARLNQRSALPSTLLLPTTESESSVAVYDRAARNRALFCALADVVAVCLRRAAVFAGFVIVTGRPRLRSCWRNMLMVIFAAAPREITPYEIYII